MILSHGYIIIVFIISFFVSFFLTPYIRKIAIRYNVLDKPTHRKTHKRIIPLWGGLSIFIAFIFTVSIVVLFINIINVRYIIGVIIGGFIIIVFGMVDDKIGISPGWKLFIQIISALVLSGFGVRIYGFQIPFSNFYFNIPFIFSIVITVFWIVAIINALNFIDGLDGLCTGITIISGITFFVILLITESRITTLALHSNIMLASVLSVILIGSASGFIYFNFHPASIFLGDSGSMFLGFIISSIAIIGALKSAALIAVMIPVLIMALPLFDVIYAIVRRIRERRPLSKPDRKHFHYQLLSYGMSHKNAVFFLYSINIMLCLLAIFLSL